MARTIKRSDKPWYRRESSQNKRITRRAVRAKDRARLRSGEYDLRPVHRATEGWLTH